MNPLKDSINKAIHLIVKKPGNIFLASCVVSIIFILLLCLFYPIRYHANDDLAIEGFLSSGYNAVFMTLTAGKLIKFLYTFSNSIGFYAITLMFVHSISLAVFIYCFVLLHKKAVLKTHEIILLTLAFILLYTRFVTEFTFTTTAFMAGFAGIALFITSKSRNPGHLLPMLFSGLLLAVSFLLRPGAANGVILFSLPLLLIAFIFFTPEKNKLKISLLSLLLLLMPFAITRQAEKIVYKVGTSEEYKEYRRYNSLRGSLHDNRMITHVYDNEEVFELNEWTHNDLDMFRHWFFAHEEKFNYEALLNIREAIPERKITGTDTLKVLLTRGLATIKTLVRYYYIHLLFITSCFLFLINRKQSRFSFAALIFFFIYVAAAVYYLSAIYSTKARVLEPLILGSCMAALFLFTAFKSHEKMSIKLPARLISYVAVAMLTVIVLWQTPVFIRNYQLVQEGRKQLKEFIAMRNQKYAGYVMLNQPGYGVGGGIRNVFRNPFRPVNYKSEVAGAGGGWNTFSPRYYYRIHRALDIDQASDLLPAMIDNENAIIVGTEHFVEMLETFIYETYDIQVEACIFSELGIDHYQLVSAE